MPSPAPLLRGAGAFLTPLLCAVIFLPSPCVRGAAPAHVFDAADPANTLTGSDLTQWTDVGPGFTYGSTVKNININNVTGITQTAAFQSFGTLLTHSFICDGTNTNGAKPQGEPQSASIGNGLVNGSVEIWFRTDLGDTEREVWQVLLESGATTNGFCVLLKTNGIFPAEMRVMKAWASVKVIDMTVELPNFEDSDFIQAVVTFDGDTTADGDDAARLHVRDVFGNTATIEDLTNDFESLAGSDDSCVFNAANGTEFAKWGSCGGNVGNAVLMSAFKGEIALINVYGSALTAGEVDTAYTTLVDQGDDDMDNMPNWWELFYGLNPDSGTDATLDGDGDGLNNLGEYNNSTRPTDPDTDDDGLDDGDEISVGSNPLLPDSDGDGLTDGDEASANPFVTSPILADTDSDLVPDPVELMVGSDPTLIGSTAPTLLISEFMASNGVTLLDEDGDNTDWIEIVNATAAPVDLGGYHLTDNDLNLIKWQFPAGVVLQPGDFLVVFASAKDRAVAGQQLHTNFLLSAGGEYLALVAPDGTTIIHDFGPGVPNQETDISFDLNDLYLTQPTPGAVNIGPGVTGFVKDTKFSIDRGFYTAPFTVDITTNTPGATIVYTTDSTTPSLTNGTQVPGSFASVSITGSTVLRAAAFKSGLAPTNTDTHTYLFLSDVVTQSDDPNNYEYPNWNNLSNNRTADYGMDQTDIVGTLYTEQQVQDALLSLPTISVATDAEKLFDRETGNYSNSKKTGMEWERAISMEFFGFAHGQTIQTDGGLRLAGNASRSDNRHKHNMRVAFRRQYGDGTLEFPLFPDSEVTTFNSIQLRGGNGDSWVHPGADVRARATYNRDQWHRDVHRAMGGHSQTQLYAHLYINGMYWGVFHVFERIEDDYLVYHEGGNEEDWDVRDHFGAFDGTEDAWLAAYAIADDPAGMANLANYTAIQQHLELNSFADWLLLHFYSNSDDWDQNNIRMARNRVDPDTWKFYTWDQERALLNSLSTPDVNGTKAIDKNTNSSTKKGPTHVHQKLRDNPEYRLLFADRVRKHCFNGGALTPAQAAAAWDARADQVRQGMIGESARWGDLHEAIPKTPADWDAQIAIEKSGWFDIRTPILISLLQTADLYPLTAAPDFAIDGTPQHGGPTPSGAILGISAPTGTIYFTIDASDPRATGGAIQGTEYLASFALTQPVTVKARVLDGGVWSALTEAQYSVGTAAGPGNLVFSEIMYHPLLDENEEFLELLNISPTDTIDLTGVTFVEGIDFDFADNTIIPAGGRLLIVRNQLAFEAVYGTGLPIAGEFQNTTGLANGGEQLRLEDVGGSPIQDFEYNDKNGWPEGADGGGASLVLIKPSSDPDHSDPLNWRTSVSVSGNPGSSDDTSFAAWALSNGVSDPNGDSDHDGLKEAIEYYLGSDPMVPDSLAGPTDVIVDDGGILYFGLEFTRQPAADDATGVAEHSVDLVNWSNAAADVVLVSNTRNPDGTETIIFRSTLPLGSEVREFLRLKVTIP